MVEVEMDDSLLRLQNLLDRISMECPRKLASETRHAAIYICQSLRKRTKSAPARVRSGEYAAVPSPVPPRYINSNSSGHQLLRRWMLTRKLGTPDVYAKHYYVYTSARRVKGRRVGKNLASERRELIRLHGGISRHGLAKKSWGWVMKQIYSAMPVEDLLWRRTKGERRNPAMAVKGRFVQDASGAMAEIMNHLDYIAAAMPPAAVNESINAAVARLEHNLSRALA